MEELRKPVELDSTSYDRLKWSWPFLQCSGIFQGSTNPDFPSKIERRMSRSVGVDTPSLMDLHR